MCLRSPNCFSDLCPIQRSLNLISAVVAWGTTFVLWLQISLSSELKSSNLRIIYLSKEAPNLNCSPAFVMPFDFVPDSFCSCALGVYICTWNVYKLSSYGSKSLGTYTVQVSIKIKTQPPCLCHGFFPLITNHCCTTKFGSDRSPAF